MITHWIYNVLTDFKLLRYRYTIIHIYFIKYVVNLYDNLHVFSNSN